MGNLLEQMGRRLTMRRKQLGLTQEVLAERAELTTQTVSTAETGKKALRPENIVKLCGALEISTDYLFYGTVSDGDVSPLFEKMNALPPQQYRQLEKIILNYIAAVLSPESEV